ncbi:MAG: M15 family metallopeptidase [Nitrospiraceae bacterium]|nr:MAG: M15 family metallopeptidase [Nitrospiraceae bacterium]
MKRRDFLKICTMGVIGWGITPDAVAQNMEIFLRNPSENPEDHIKDYLDKMNHFNEPHVDDVHINSILYKVFQSTVMRFRRLEQFVGHGNFQILSFDDGLEFARKNSQVGKFSGKEIRFLEMIFYAEAQQYGFLGQKHLNKITDRINTKEVTKIPHTGNYLFRGIPFETYKKIKQQVGEQVILTSGIRGIMKQFLLFLNNAYRKKGNLSLASRSLAPPGYSFHSNGDFDVGQAGFGILNFAEQFTSTEVYEKLNELGYLTLRYPKNNLLGVRYEPWHIKVSS